MRLFGKEMVPNEGENDLPLSRLPAAMLHPIEGMQGRGLVLVTRKTVLHDPMWPCVRVGF